MYKCEWALEHMPAFLGEQLASRERETLLRHLACCEACRVELAQTMRLVRAIQAIDPPVPGDVSANAFALVRAGAQAPDYASSILKAVSGPPLNLAGRLLNALLLPVRDSVSYALSQAQGV